MNLKKVKGGEHLTVCVSFLSGIYFLKFLKVEKTFFWSKYGCIGCSLVCVQQSGILVLMSISQRFFSSHYG